MEFETLEIADTVIEDCEADGGAITVWAANVRATNLTVRRGRNTDGTYCGGGASLLGVSNFTCDGCTFDSNRAGFGTHGGGICSWADAGFLTLTRSTFTNNTAEGRGGAVHFEGVGGMPELTVEDCVFENNTAVTGWRADARTDGHPLLPTWQPHTHRDPAPAHPSLSRP